MFKSTNGGDSWAAASTGITTNEIYALALNPLNPAVLYAGTYRGVFKSTNSGGDWNQLTNGIPTTAAYSLAVNPQDPAQVYAATDSGVYSSSDAGLTWFPDSSGLTNPFVRAISRSAPRSPKRSTRARWAAPSPTWSWISRCLCRR